MKSGRSLVELARELERQLGTKKDLLVPLPRTHHRTAEDGECALEVEEPAGVQRYGITPLARRQLAEKLKIPYAYFERMRTEQPELLDRNVNAWLEREEGERQLLRTLDGKVRAVLSERYRRLDNYDLLEHVLPTLQRLPDARLESVELTETRLYLKVITPRIAFEVAPGDVVQAGVVVSNSEVGCGMLSVQPLAFRLVCSNGLIASDRMLRKTHVGRPLDAEPPIGHRLQGRYAAGRRPGLLPEGPRRRRDRGVRVDAAPRRREAAPHEGDAARRRPGPGSGGSSASATDSPRPSGRGFCAA